MANNIKRIIFVNSIGLFWLITFLSGCASVQSPTGGPKDTIPPSILKENPKNFTKNFVSKKVDIEFNEFIKLANEYTEISISPAIDIPPEFKVKKENLGIEYIKNITEK